MKYERFEIWEDSRERLLSSLAVIAALAWLTAKRFVSEGACVFITGRRQDELDKAVATLGSGVIQLEKVAVPIAVTYPLDEVKAAVAQALRGGKVLLEVEGALS